MTTRLQQIQATVAAHFAARDAAEEAVERLNDDGEPTSNADNDALYNYNKYHAQFHPAMTMLSDLLPLLEATNVLNDELASSDAHWKHRHIYDVEVAKLLEDVQP